MTGCSGGLGRSWISSQEMVLQAHCLLRVTFLLSLLRTERCDAQQHCVDATSLTSTSRIRSSYDFQQYRTTSDSRRDGFSDGGAVDKSHEGGSEVVGPCYTTIASSVLCNGRSDGAAATIEARFQASEAT